MAPAPQSRHTPEAWQNSRVSPHLPSVAVQGKANICGAEGEKSIEAPQEVILENDVRLRGFLLQVKTHN